MLRVISKVQAAGKTVKGGRTGKGEGQLLDLSQDEVDDDNGDEEEGEEGEEVGEADELEEQEEATAMDGGEELSQEEGDGEPGAQETQEMQEVQEACGCPMGLVSQIPGSGVKLGDQQGLVLVGQVLATGLQAICH